MLQKVFKPELTEAEKKVIATDLLNVALLKNGSTVVGILVDGVINYPTQLKQIAMGMNMTMSASCPLDCGTDKHRDGSYINIPYSHDEIKSMYRVTDLEAHTCDEMIKAYMSVFGLLDKKEQTLETVPKDSSEYAGAPLSASEALNVIRGGKAPRKG